MHFKNIILVLLTTALLSGGVLLIYAENSEDQIRTIFLDIDDAYMSKNLERVMMYYSENFSSGIISRDLVEESVRKFFETYEDISLETKISNLKMNTDNIVVESESTVKAKKVNSDEKLDMTEKDLNFLKKEKGHWKIVSVLKLESTEGIVSGDVFTDEKLSYTITKLPQWNLYKIVIPGKPLIISSVLILSPDLTSSVILGLVELPTSLSAQQVVKDDEEATKSMAVEYKLISEGWTDIKGEKAYESLSKFTLRSESTKRRRVYFTEDKLAYFLLCDSPPDTYSQYELDFDKIVNSFSFLKKEESGSIRNRIAEKLAKGSITGNIYTNTEYGFQIAGPPDWVMTSASTNFLFQINIMAPDSNSFVMFGAVKLPVEMSAKDVIISEEKATKTLASEYTLLSEKETAIGGESGYETITRFVIGGIDRQRRRAYFVKDDIAYFFVCDAVPPSKYDEHSNQFENIIKSLTWN